LPSNENCQLRCGFPLEIDCQAILPPSIADDTSPNDPLRIDPFALRDWVNENAPILVVHKLSASTGLTHGKCEEAIPNRHNTKRIAKIRNRKKRERKNRGRGQEQRFHLALRSTLGPILY
jgi:hypothetical protein